MLMPNAPSSYEKAAGRDEGLRVHDGRVLALTVDTGSPVHGQLQLHAAVAAAAAAAITTESIRRPYAICCK